MLPREINELQSRWTTSKAKRAAALLKSSNLNAESFPFPPIEHEGKRFIDLRGINPNKPILELTAEYVDFSYGIFPAIAGLGFANLQHCLFVLCTYENALSDSFQFCNFSQAKMRRLQTGYDMKFENCTFRDADLSNSDCSGTHFIHCDFTGARFLRTQFFQCVFDGCKFEKAKFGQGCLASCVMRNFQESFIWTDDWGKPLQHLVAGATAVVDLRNTLLSTAIFEQ